MRGLGVLLVLVLAVAASACGGSSEPTAAQAPQDAIVLAASKTNDAGTYKADISGTVDAAGQSVELSGTGAFDGPQKRGSMTMTTSVASQKIDMDVVYAYPAMYMRFPPGLLPLPTGKPWVKIDLQELSQRAGFGSVPLMESQQQVDPSQGLEYLEGVSDVQAAGEEDIRGVPTTHYKGVVDLNHLADKNPELKSSLDALMQQTGTSRIPIEAWIDHHGFVRQIKETFDAREATTSMTIQFYDFGTNVDVSPPPADETVDLAHLIGQS